MDQVCRTCLEEICDSNSIHLNNTSYNIKEALRACLPEVDVELIPDAAMCTYCVNDLRSSYDFKRKCLSTEEQIRTHLHSHVVIDLAEIKKSCEGDGNGDNGLEIVAAFEINGSGSFNKAVVNGDSLQADGSVDVEDEDDDMNCNDLVLGVSESAPRQPQPTCSTSKPIPKEPPTFNNISPIRREVNSARKSTTKGARSLISPISKLPDSILLKKISTPNKNSSGICCGICSASMSGLIDYMTHIKSFHMNEKSKIYKCPVCTYSTKIPSGFLKHGETHFTPTAAPVLKPYKCPHCDFGASEMKVLNRHIDSHILKCSKCYYVATNRATYQKHLSTHSCTMEVDDDVVVIEEDDEDIQCVHCKFIAKGCMQYEKHSLELHGIKYPYNCNECGYTTARKANLTKHAKFHDGNRLFRCKYCSYNCDLQYNIDKHTASRHKGES